MTKTSAPTVELEQAGGDLSFPNDWREARLGDLFEIQQGKALNAKHRNNGNQRPFLRTANVLWGCLELGEVDQMAFSEEEERRLALKRGDLLSCEGGDVGRTAMWHQEITPCYYQNHLHRLRTNRDDVEPEFFMRWLDAAIRLLGLYGGTSNKTTIPNLSKNRLASFVVPIPHVAEQRAIATVLRTVQEAKEVSERVIAATRQLKASLLQHLFTYGPVEADQADRVSASETEIGTLPAHWRVIRLRDCARIRYGLGQPPSSSPDGVPMIRATNIKRGRIASEGMMYVAAQAIPRGKDPYLKPGDILVVRSGAYTGDVAAVDKTWSGAIAGYDLIVTPDERVRSDVLVQYLLGPTAQKYFHSQRDRSAQPHLNSQQLGDTPVPLAPMNEQQAIAEKLSAVDIKIWSEERRVAALEQLFRSMLRHLMTGAVRLPEFVSST